MIAFRGGRYIVWEACTRRWSTQAGSCSNFLHFFYENPDGTVSTYLVLKSVQVILLYGIQDDSSYICLLTGHSQGLAEYQPSFPTKG